MNPVYVPWPEIRPGDRVLIRERRSARELVVDVAEILPALEGEGAGLRDNTGATIRHHFYDARPVQPDTDLPDQREIDARFAQLTDTRTR